MLIQGPWNRILLLWIRVYYTYTDDSKDNVVFTLYNASEGSGHDLVHLGEAFVDKDMESVGILWANDDENCYTFLR